MSVDEANSCHICGQKFSLKSNLQIHMLNHGTSSKPFKCNLCTRQFSLKSSLKIHALHHTQKKNFNVLGDLRFHLKSYNLLPDYKCNICGRKFSFKTSLDIHLLDHSQSESYYECMLCEQHFVSSENLRDHMKIHNNETHTGSKRCKENKQNLDSSIITPKESLESEKKFEEYWKSDLNETLNIIHNPINIANKIIPINIANKIIPKVKVIPKKVFTLVNDYDDLTNIEEFSLIDEDLKDISKTFGSSTEIDQRHSSIETLNTSVVKNSIEENSISLLKDTNSCNDAVSNKIYDKERSLKEHISTLPKHFQDKVNIVIHSKWKYECKICLESFTSKRNIRKHLITHLKDIECDLCQEKFATKVKLQEHLIAMHPQKTKRKGNTAITQSVKIKRHACSTCKKRFTSSDTLLQHKNQESYRCDLCSLQFTLCSEHKDHVKSHYTCSKCGKKFMSSDAQLEHENKKSYKCALCNLDLDLCFKYKEHLKSHSLSCQLCGKVFSKRNLLRQHVRIHETDVQQCSVCQKLFRNKLSLRHHMIRVHASNDKQYQCEKCGKTFKRLGLLRQHERIHAAEKRYVCKVCNRKFVQSAHLQNHMKTHSGLKDYTCDICGRAFALKSTLDMHKKRHSKVKDYICSKCGKGFIKLKSMQSHMLSHTGEKPFICEMCPNRYLTKNALNYHVLNSHAPKNISNCVICGKKYVSKYHLYNHYMQHSQVDLQLLDKKLHLEIINFTKSDTGRSNTRCKFCGKFCISNAHLKQHERIHTGEKTFKCSYCGKAFRLKNSLIIHIRSHTGERPYSCEKCDKCFVQFAHLRAHETVHTGEKPYLCSYCGKAFGDKNNLHAHKKRHLRGTSSSNDKNTSVCNICGIIFANDLNLQKKCCVNCESKVNIQTNAELAESSQLFEISNNYTLEYIGETDSNTETLTFHSIDSNIGTDGDTEFAIYRSTNINIDSSSPQITITPNDDANDGDFHADIVHNIILG